jgi:protein O-GlcNAc transferase
MMGWNNPGLLPVLTEWLRASPVRAEEGSAMTEISIAPIDAGAAFHIAVRHIESGQFDLGRQELENLVEADPYHFRALVALAQLGLHLGEYDRGALYATRAAALDDGDPSAHFVLGRLRKGQGRLAESEACYRRAIALRPDFAEARVSLGIVLKAQGRLDEAISCYELALRQRPGFPEAQVNLANALRERGQESRAHSLYREAVASAPELPEAQSAMAATLLLAGHKEDAIEHYRRSLQRNPDQPRLQYVLGCLLVETKQPGALEAFSAAVHFQPVYPDAWANLGLELCAAGRRRDGIGCFERAIVQNPKHLQARINLAMSVGEVGDAAAAERILRDVLADYPDSRLVRNKLGIALMWGRKLEEATGYLREPMEHEPQDPTHKVMLGMCLQGPGRQGQAVDLMSQALESNPEDHNGYSNLLLSMSYWDGASAADIAAVARRIGATRFARPAAGHAAFPEDPVFRDPARRLRIGYVSPDLHRHSVSFFFAPVLAGHDEAAFEVFCYHNHVREDDVSASLRGDAEHWFNSYGLTDEQFAARVRDDGIDILVDLAGHTAHNRLLAFALRPAPVQMTWLGFPTTVGFPDIGWRISDWQVDPAGHDRHSTEALLRLPNSYFCYRPGPSPAVSLLPAHTAGHVTFGSFNALVKVSETTVAAWAAVLAAVPRSRLILKTSALGEAETRSRLLTEFRSRGIDPGRIEMLAWEEKTESHLATYRRVDIALDTFPYNGATTTCEALWMGVPVVSLSGDTHASRMGRSLLTAAGLRDLVADSVDGFVRAAAGLASDLDGLELLRGGLREQLRSSVLMDEIAFTRSLETLYCHAWQQWCAGGMQ